MTAVLRAEVTVPLRDFALDVGLACDAGAPLALAGPSGAGKSTLLRAIAGLARPSEGRVECGGELWLDTGRGLHVAPERRRCGYLFQDQALFPHMTALENVAYPLRGRRRERDDAARALLGRFGLDDAAQARPADLSGGERARVALARALASRPRALLLDEPLAALDPRTRGQASRELAATIRDAGVPAIVVTHDFAEAAALADDVAVLDRGRILQRGRPDELAATPVSAFVADLTGASVLTGTAAPGPDGLTVVEVDGGGCAVSADKASGRVAVTVFPWEIALEPAGAAAPGSPRNHLDATVVSVTTLGNRARVGLVAPQPLAAEVTAAAVRELGLAAGARVTATWKATATRVVPL